MGHEVTLVAVNTSTSQQSGVRLVNVRSPATRRLNRMVVLTARVWNTALAQKADVYHFHDPELLPGALLARLLGKAVIYDVHEEVHLAVLDKDYMPAFGRHLTAAAFRKLERFAVRLMSETIAANESTFHRLSLVSAHVTHVANYPLRNELLPGVDAQTPRRGVAYVGVISADRGIREMVVACERAGVPLLLAGRFETDELYARISALPGWANVRYSGVVDRPGVASILGKAIAGLVLLHPNHNNPACLSTKLLEYMSAGIPVIASDFPSYRAVVERFRCGLCVSPLDVDAIAAAISRLAEDPGFATEMGRRGRDAIATELNWESQLPKLEAVYGNAAAK
jgi:glycosyltransferase involved in cell wall biosynthesis